MVKTVCFLGYSSQQTRLVSVIEKKGYRIEEVSGLVDSFSPYDVVISFGYRHIIDAARLRTLRRPIINLHIAYLPYNRGAHPNFWSHIEGTPPGVTIHEIDAGIDTGPICFQTKSAFNKDEITFAAIYGRLISEVEALFIDHANELLGGTYQTTPQTGPSSYHYAVDLPKWMTDWNMNVDEAARRYIKERKVFDVIIILANEMDQNGALNEETKSRLGYACQVYLKGRAKKILLMGWDYRADSSLCISDAMNNHLHANFAIKSEDVLIDRSSRDTVGDAVFSRRDFGCLLAGNAICVVTSDYHRARTKAIFDFVYGDNQEVDVIGVHTGRSAQMRRNENASTAAFHKTFAGVLAGDHDQIFAAMIERHPFYNGAVHPKFPPDPGTGS